MATYTNKACGTKVELLDGKFYVFDAFSGPCSGPFDSFEEADADMRGTNIEEDCQVALCERQQNGKYKFEPATPK